MVPMMPGLLISLPDGDQMILPDLFQQRNLGPHNRAADFMVTESQLSAQDGWTLPGEIDGRNHADRRPVPVTE